MTISEVSLASIKPHPKNARKHDGRNIQVIMQSLQHFGQRTPLVVGKGGLILKGCGTFAAMQRLGWKSAQVIKVTTLTPAQELAYSIADNKSSDLSDFDYESLSGTLRFLKDLKFDLDSTGFADYERDPLLLAEWKPAKDAGGEGPSGNTSLSFGPEHMAVIDGAVMLAKKLQLVDMRSRYPDSLCALCAEFLKVNSVNIPKAKKAPPPRKG